MGSLCVRTDIFELFSVEASARLAWTPSTHARFPRAVRAYVRFVLEQADVAPRGGSTSEVLQHGGGGLTPPRTCSTMGGGRGSGT